MTVLREAEDTKELRDRPKAGRLLLIHTTMTAPACTRSRVSLQLENCSNRVELSQGMDRMFMVAECFRQCFITRSYLAFRTQTLQSIYTYTHTSRRVCIAVEFAEEYIHINSSES